MPADSAPPRLIIVTGVSGAGHTSAMRVLEDLGFYCVDNLPIALAPTVLRLAHETGKDFAGVALGIDSRQRTFFGQWPVISAELEREGAHPEVLFLDASDEVLARRYSETRRPHPLGQTGKGIVDMIREERTALSEMRERASRIIDTSTTTVHELREHVTAAVIGSTASDRMVISIVSFGYKYGAPVGLDLVLDVRFIPNPFFIPELKPLTGLDAPVHAYVMSKPESQQFIDEVGRMLDFLIPLYRREGKSYLTIGLGCTGGRHRSPALARELRDRLARSGYQVLVRDQDVAR